MAHFSREERAFMAVRNHRMVQLKRKANELEKSQQLQALPDNTKVRKQLLGDWSTHLHKRGSSIDTYNAFKRPSELH